ncbi:MAG TPA: efflux RND transporter periplasmic adaptor subunit [Vicinamibacterales bacterium]|nr:efflux RND transporter periplasmic adaptor subunit [Vicinamibacterales bacterium]
MTQDNVVRIRPAVAVGLAIALLSIGAATMYFLTRGREPGVAPSAPSAATPVAPNTAPAGGEAGDMNRGDHLPDVAIPISEESIARAGISTTVVAAAQGTAEIRLPGVVEANAYKQVVVTPLVSGRVTQVSAELGAHVKRGQPIAQVYSPELAEAQTKYVAARAMLDAHDRELQRTEKLVAIGAASRQELERTHAEHTVQVADLEAARSRLLLLGIPADAIGGLSAGKSIGSTATVVAPLDGVVTERFANVGLNVDPATKLFAIVDLTTVWIVADVYEKDLPRVSVGASVATTTAAYPDRLLEGRVSYIDPQVSAATRTARARIEVANPRGDLRLGMYATVLIRTPAPATAIFLPRTAIQQVGDRQVVYLKSQNPGMFVERQIATLPSSGDRIEVLSGLQTGDTVVTEGSFFIRAERERLGLRSPGANPPHTTGDSGAARPSMPAAVSNARVEITERGFEPSSLKLRAGVPARVTFLRSTDKTCGKDVVFPSMNIRRELPLNQPVVVEFTPQRGEVEFACGMNMLKGTIVVE